MKPSAPKNDDLGSMLWTTTIIECRICSHRSVAVVPGAHPNGVRNFECDNCGNMTCDTIGESDEEPWKS